MLAVFQLPLSSDPNINTSSDGELLNSNSYDENPYACDMLRHSIPLDYHVSSKVKSDVWCDNYVNFALLLPSNNDDTCNESTLFENLNITISNRKSNKELLSIHQWTNAFDIFMSIYLEKNLRSSIALIKYGFNVRSLCKSLGFQAAEVYDEKFRKIRKILGLQLDQINDELWRSAALYERQSDFSGQNKKSYAKTSNSGPILFKGGPSISINSQMAIAGPSVNQGNAQQSFVNSNTNVYTAARNTVPLHVQSKKENRQTLSKLPTPIKVENLEHFLVGYETQLKDKLIHGFSFGFSINSCFSTSLTKKIFPPNHKSARENYHVVQSKLNKEIEAGRVKGPFTKPPFPLFVCSPLGLVPKKETNSYRLIHDLSYPKGDSVNSGISPEFSAVQYQNIETVIDLVQSYESNCLMSKTDIEHAFRLIPIAKKRSSSVRFSLGQTVLL
ncbi:uncharacterized protein LOC134708617 [Mytilus trossulus]|uniref:uncharacterized protein LOC134708617 n=1 Tax=Mytilus trossulus TaxID=6551 RepID=UPI0030062B51